MTLPKKLEGVADFQTVFRGGSRIFSKGGGGGGFSKKFRNFVDLFLSTKLIFPSSPKAQTSPCFSQNLCAAGKILKNRPKRVFRHFLENFTEKSYFFGARYPLKLVYIGAKAPLEIF